MTYLLQKIESIINSFDTEVQNSLENIVVRKQLKKGEFLLQEGIVCRKCFVLEEGIARKYLIAKNKEVTTELYYKNDIMVSFDSFCNQIPSVKWIQTLSKATVIQLNFHEFQTLKALYPELIKLDLTIAEHYTIWLEKKLIDFRTLDASERYLNLLKKKPHYLQHIPLNITASYLGVAIETLSRIRAKV